MYKYIYAGKRGDKGDKGDTRQLTRGACCVNATRMKELCDFLTGLGCTESDGLRGEKEVVSVRIFEPPRGKVIPCQFKVFYSTHPFLCLDGVEGDYMPAVVDWLKDGFKVEPVGCANPLSYKVRCEDVYQRALKAGFKQGLGWFWKYVRYCFPNMKMYPTIFEGRLTEQNKNDGSYTTKTWDEYTYEIYGYRFEPRPLVQFTT